MEVSPSVAAPQPSQCQAEVQAKVSWYPTPLCSFWKGSLCLNPGTFTSSSFQPGCFRKSWLHLLVTFLVRGSYPHMIFWRNFSLWKAVFEAGQRHTLSSGSRDAEQLYKIFVFNWKFLESKWNSDQSSFALLEIWCLLYTYFPDNLIDSQKKKSINVLY